MSVICQFIIIHALSSHGR
ncbi:hypothetical protein F383_01592 [Gossypium arboreum]|uniref:Uncharacterized protein n=1 Tax=Gossypium arboreum TaxID=29729 RepID=A0A0B0NRM7_GOSAR|nr:hypothetical protein F383_01592 [Gossypium arboreum]